MPTDPKSARFHPHKLLIRPDFHISTEGAEIHKAGSEQAPRLLVAGDWASIRIHADAAQRTLINERTLFEKPFFRVGRFDG